MTSADMAVTRRFTMRSMATWVLAAAIAGAGLIASDGLAQTTIPKPGDVMKAAKLVDLNKASLDDIKKLPGLTEAKGKEIIAGRPFKAADDLVSKNILSKDVFEKIKPLVTVAP
jgi:DNA uptake protein ComE-like DNA-binding protein